MKFRAGGLPVWAAPLLILLVCFYSFGILLSRLGFFQDDWHHVFYAYWQGAQGLQRFLLADRGPFAWIVYFLSFRILGYTPAAWHWALMLLRAMTAVALWFSLRRIWPGENGLTAWIALLFAVYPIFTLQPLAVAYTLHWIMYLVFMLSLYLMILAVRTPKNFVPLTAAGVAMEVIHLVFIEYFSGLELARLVFLWFIFPYTPVRDRLKKVIWYGAPYLITLALYAVYRSSYGVIFGYDRFTPLVTLLALVRNPISGLATVLQTMLQDIVYVVLSPWYAAVAPAVIDLERPSTYLIFGSAVGIALAVYFVIQRLEHRGAEQTASPPRWELAWGGLMAAVLALLPFWLTGLSIYQKNLLWSERLALAVMPGASLFVAGTIYALIDRDGNRNLVLSALLGLAVGLHVQTARNFQASWDKQKEFYWQLHWRAPALQPNTLIVSDQEILFYMGIYPTAFSINLLYPQTTPAPEASYWFNAGFEHVKFDEFSAGAPVTFEKYATTFTATAEDVVAITFEPGQDQCLWILDPKYANVRGLTPEAGTWLRISNPSRILALPETIPPPEIFGAESPHTWCYFFEKADLASQSQAWDKIIQFWREAGQQGSRSGNGIELMPFIMAYARLGDWEAAKQLTIQAQALPDRSSSALCDLWRNIGSATLPSVERDETLSDVESLLGCQR